MEYKIGMVIKGKITGIQPYGAFVSLDNNQQGLIHVSEVKHGFIKNISDELEIGQSVTVKIIEPKGSVSDDSITTPNASSSSSKISA